MDAEGMAAIHESELEAGVVQANVMARMVDLRNANAAGVAFENRRRVVEAFSEPGKLNGTEVQVRPGVLLDYPLFRSFRS
jgi:small subunit ribosomal protein S15